MPVLLQINVTANWGSTGKIAEQIGRLSMSKGWECYIAYGRYYNPSQLKLVRVGCDIGVYEHYIEHCLFDNDGLASRGATKQLIKKIEEIKPDVIHLHNIHDHWLNYRILFEYLNTLDIPIVWTQHDCWSITGGCGYFTALCCEMWKNGCTEACPFRLKQFTRHLINHAKEHYELKKEQFCATKNLTLVPVSHWLEGVIRESFLKDNPIYTIYNGVDINVFKPIDGTSEILNKYGLGNTNYVVGVATAWSERKGFLDYCRLSSLMPLGTRIVLVGLNDRMKKEARHYGIIGIPRTSNVQELVELYNGASIVMNLSYEETFGLTTVEGFACGTPSIVYNTTASPELVDSETGLIVEPGDVEGVARAIEEILQKGKSYYTDACRRRAVEYFDKDKCFEEYLKLYERLLAK